MAKTNYQELTQYNSPNYTPYAQVPAVYGMSREIIGIVYHWWGDPALNPLFLNIISWLCRANGNSSAHVVGEMARIAWIINAIDAAWHAGNARGNAKYVGYECNPRLSDGDYQTMGEFHYDMEKAYNKTLEIRVHKEFTTTACSPIDKARIRRIADGLHAQDNTPAPAPVREASREVYNPVKKFVFANNCILEKIPGGGDANPGTVYKKGDKVDIKQKLTMTDGSVWYRTPYSSDKEIATGFRAANLTPYVEVVPDPEWIRNLKWDDSIGKLSVLPAGGTRVLNLITTSNVNDEIIPKGTQIDIVGQTTVGGKKYYISSYSKTKGLPWGIPADTLGVPVVEPPKEKPEWLNNLKDIADQTFYTRSDTPLLNVEDGSTSRVVPINTPVRITHATEILGTPYMVLDGMKEVVGTVYLSDTPITNPDNDLEKRVSFIEAFITTLVEAFGKLVETLKNKWGK